MKITEKERMKAEKVLNRYHIARKDIESFSFMKRYRQTDGKRDRMVYGPGILVLHLAGGKDRLLMPPALKHPTSLLRYLLAHDIPFETPPPQQKKNGTEIPASVYKRPSLYMLYFFVLFLAFLTLGYHLVSVSTGWSIAAAIVSFGLSLVFVSMLQTRFCFLSLDKDELVVHSAGRTLRYPYFELLKVNFDFAREQNFTHVMELVDNQYRYRLFYIGRVPRTKLKEICSRLQDAGVDATCSLNDRKRYYEDTHMIH